MRFFLIGLLIMGFPQEIHSPKDPKLLCTEITRGIGLWGEGTLSIYPDVALFVQSGSPAATKIRPIWGQRWVSIRVCATEKNP